MRFVSSSSAKFRFGTAIAIEELAGTEPARSAAKRGCSILGSYEETYRFAGNVVDSLSACVGSEGGGHAGAAVLYVQAHSLEN
jgi:hypothetical protein